MLVLVARAGSRVSQQQQQQHGALSFFFPGGWGGRARAGREHAFASSTRAGLERGAPRYSGARGRGALRALGAR